MPLAPTGELVYRAASVGNGIGAFNVVQLEHAEAITAGAEAARAPVILQISENTARYHGDLEPLARATLSVASKAGVPVAVHLDHATEIDLIAQAVSLGFGSIMYDASRSPYEQNVHSTKAAVARCHQAGLWVEAELGEIGGKEGVHALGTRTNPDEARRYVQDTGVDALAVAIGTSHAMPVREAHLDLGLLDELRSCVPVPLVLHGSSGVPDEDLSQAVNAGITKVNIATQLNKVMTKAIRSRLDADVALVDPRVYIASGRDAVAHEVTRLLAVLRAGHGF